MSQYEQKDNSGSIFSNNKKAENHPDFKGKCKVNGVEMEVALWKKVSAKGVEWMSMSFSEPWVNPNANVEQPAQPKAEDSSNEMPF